MRGPLDNNFQGLTGRQGSRFTVSISNVVKCLVFALLRRLRFKFVVATLCFQHQHHPLPLPPSPTLPLLGWGYAHHNDRAYF